MTSRPVGLEGHCFFSYYAKYASAVKNCRVLQISLLDQWI